MWTVGRWVSGFLIGCVLFAWSFMLTGAGHGSSVPFASAAPFWLFNRDFFVHVGIWGFLMEWAATGLLWAIYFGVFPAIGSFVFRLLLLLVVVVVHLGIAARELANDFLLRDSFTRFPILTGGYFGLFLLVLVSLGVVVLRRSKQRLAPVPS